jgi:hypothetical protein
VKPEDYATSFFKHDAGHGPRPYLTPKSPAVQPLASSATGEHTAGVNRTTAFTRSLDHSELLHHPKLIKLPAYFGDPATGNAKDSDRAGFE